MINPQIGLQAQQAASALPVPMNMYMNPTIPPNFFAAQQPGEMFEGFLLAIIFISKSPPHVTQYYCSPYLNKVFIFI